ncbi:hypothetical protein COY62_04125 [bacterium (Candidatus Howlettbacteria) CG_4_10_14_0_8_um_filter_40_9]|nr:MAG: hypothetical protein COY62_04125 [bacterium (Candidatus Howlettbacteria) CG_4_10_14_0_8_um_filter_40_9]
MESDSKQKLPFEITPQIVRYLDDILYIHREWRQQKPFYLIEPRLPSELQTPTRIRNNSHFWHYLERKLQAVQTFSPALMNKAVSASELRKATERDRGIVGIARVHGDTQSPFKTFAAGPEGFERKLEQVAKMGRPGISFPNKEKYIILKLLGIEPVENLRKEVEALSQEEKEKTVSGTHRLIYMNGEGDFLIGKHRDAIPFKSKKAGYYKVFVAIYKGAGGTSAPVSYKKITEHIRLHFGGKEFTTKEIQNHINNSIKRRYLEARTPDGKEIISADSEGKSVYFYNPAID